MGPDSRAPAGMFAALATELRRTDLSKEEWPQAELPQPKSFSSETLRRIRIALLTAKSHSRRANEHKLICNEARVRKSDGARPTNTRGFSAQVRPISRAKRGISLGVGSSAHRSSFTSHGQRITESPRLLYEPRSRWFIDDCQLVR